MIPRNKISHVDDCVSIQDLIDFGGTHYLMCNNLPDIDRYLWESIITRPVEDGEDYPEVYQWFITNDEWKVKQLHERVGYPYGYSDVLGLWYWGATDIGTSREILAIEGGYVRSE